MKAGFVIIVLALSASLVWLSLPVPAQTPTVAPNNCGPAEKMKIALNTRYGETILIEAFTETGVKFRVFYNKETGTWTSTVETPVLLCVIAAGKRLEIKIQGKPA